MVLDLMVMSNVDWWFWWRPPEATNDIHHLSEELAEATLVTFGFGFFCLRISSKDQSPKNRPM